MKVLIKICTIISILLGLSACSFFHGFRPDVVQGNDLTHQQVNEIKVGMTRQQVIERLGKPILINTFSKRSWNYVYTFQRVGHRMHIKRAIVNFQNGRVSSVTTSSNLNTR